MKPQRTIAGDDLLGLLSSGPSTAADADLLGIAESPVAPASYPVQRRWDRVALSTHIKVHRKIDGVVVETTDGQAQDLCIGGIGAYVPNTFVVDEKVTVEFVLPFGQRPIHFEAEVRDVRGFRYGFEFLRVEDDEREQLRESIAAFAVKRKTS